MSDQRSEAEDLTPLEAALTELIPRAGQWNRDELLFLAGQASAVGPSNENRRTRWAWPSAFAAMSALAATLLVMLVVADRPDVVLREIQPPAPDATPGGVAQRNPESLQADNPSPTISRAAAIRLRNALRPRRDETAYLDLRDRVLAFGVEASTSLPRGHSTREPGSDSSYQQLRGAMLGI